MIRPKFSYEKFINIKEIKDDISKTIINLAPPYYRNDFILV